MYFQAAVLNSKKETIKSTKPSRRPDLNGLMAGKSSSHFYVHLLLISSLASRLLLCSAVSAQSLCPFQENRGLNAEFRQRSSRFWEFEEKTSRWVEIGSPYDLISCAGETCIKVGSIKNLSAGNIGGAPAGGNWAKNGGMDWNRKGAEVRLDRVLPIRRRMSITAMSAASIWATGQSGSIYERFWNGVMWVIAPHELPNSAGPAAGVFIVNQTILALSEAGLLYQLQLDENSQPIWTEFVLKFEGSIDATETEPSPTMRIKTGAVSNDGGRLFLTTVKGALLEICEFQPPRWENHGRPPGGDVSALADTGILKASSVFSISSNGDLYEFDKNTKPAWKKHIWNEASVEAIPLAASTGCALHGLVGAHSLSLFLLTKDGFLIERRLHKRKWKWMIHGAPEGHRLSAATLIQQHDPEKVFSLFFTTSDGLLFEYQLTKYSGSTGANKEDQTEGLWVNHLHPQQAKAARGVAGAQLQPGRIIFPLDDGRLAELHFSGMGGDGVGPLHQINTRRKSTSRYEWSVIDAPESEGWNAEYCTSDRGPLNCIAGTIDALAGDEKDQTAPGRRPKPPAHQHYLACPDHEIPGAADLNSSATKSLDINFRMRAMHANRSFFCVSDAGITFEYLYADGIWLWLRHEHPTAMAGALGSYNGSLYLVDSQGSLLVRERVGNELSWINCTSLKKGRQVATGPPWDGLPGKPRRVSAEDALFFVNKRGRLLKLTVALRKFKWKDCRSPPDTRIAFIVDQGTFRANIIFVVGRNGRLYQYNALTELWHAHYQSPHLVLSRSPGTAMRPSPASLGGSIFMISENGGLVEYHWSSAYGWEWVEHGTPDRGVKLDGAPGPCLGETELFVMGSNGCVYRRNLEERAWRWTNYGYPQIEDEGAFKQQNGHYKESFNKYCNEKVAAVRPIPFSEDSLIFELQDGRLAELQRTDRTTAGWEWARIIGTPTSLCMTNYWTVVAS